MTHHVVMFSAGGGSWAAAKRVAFRSGTENLTLLFTDTLYEDADAYRFLIQGAANVLGWHLNWRVPEADEFPDYKNKATWRAFLAELRGQAAMAIPQLVWLVEGRDPWEVFRGERFLGNSSVDPCSKILKRQPADRWLRENCDPTNTVVYVGIDWTERHRLDDGKGGGLRPRRAAEGWNYQAPLCEAPWTAKPEILLLMRRALLNPPRLYAKGYAHNNCGGFCCKAGHAHYANRLRVDPDRFAEDERQERSIISYLGRSVSMLTDRAGGEGKRSLTLTQLRERVEAEPQAALALDDWGGCGCMIEEPA